MKFIYAKGACSFAVHILLEELNIEYQSIKVDLKDREVVMGFNHRGQVPVLILGDGTVLTESISILQYLSVTHQGAYMPKDIIGRTKCIEWLSFISSEMHKNTAPLFAKNLAGEKMVDLATEKIRNNLIELNLHFIENTFLVGDSYTVADMYLLAILRIYTNLGIELQDFKRVYDYKLSLCENPVIQKIEKTEEDSSIFRGTLSSEEQAPLGH